MFGELGGAALYVYRPHIFVGRTVDNYILRALRGRPSGRGWVAKAVEKLGLQVPIVLPWSSKGENLFQFAHVDDVARVLAWTVRHFRSGELKILNLCAPGEPLTLAECARMARTPIVRLAGLKVVDNLLGVLWAMGLSGVPAGSMPYFLGSYTMSTKRLREELGEDFEGLIRFTSREGLEDALSRE
jgi:nucleoside-diphosphate-sugar epimerase